MAFCVYLALFFYFCVRLEVAGGVVRLQDCIHVCAAACRGKKCFCMWLPGMSWYVHNTWGIAAQCILAPGAAQLALSPAAYVSVLRVHPV
jgi:hypothetical protein